MNGGTLDEHRYNVNSYSALVEEGLLSPDDRVELLDGIIVAMPPQQPLHATGVRWAERVLRAKLGPDANLSCQFPLVASFSSMPEPDICVLPGDILDYANRHPTRALLVVEVADSSLAQDRLTKSKIYAHAAVPEYWVVNLRGRVVEWFRDPDADARVYRERGKAHGNDPLPFVSFPGLSITAGELLPPAPAAGRF